MRPLRFRVWLLLLVLMLTGKVPAIAQSPAKNVPTCRMGASAGARRYRPGAWGVVAVDARNPTDEATEVSAAIYLDADPMLQFGRRVWVPAKSILTSTCPIRIPEKFTSDVGFANIVSAPVDGAEGVEAAVHSYAESMSASRPLILYHEPIAVGILGDFEDPYPLGDDSAYYTGPELVPPIRDDSVYEMVLAAKRGRELSRRVSVFNAGELPADPACLDALDVLVLCSDELASAPEGTALVRNWVLGGGHLWITLDDVQQDSVAAILGDAFTSTIVDRVGLTELRIDDARPDVEHKESEVLEFEEPVAFVRVVPRDVAVTDLVDGWPAAFRQNFGAGQVFFTTLGPPAWMRPTMPDDPAPADSANATPFVARETLQRLVAACFAARDRESLDVDAIQPFLAKQIGYRILPRAVVTGILAAFCGIVGLAGLRFWRTGRLERLLWVAPCVAAVTSLIFLGVATTSRRSVPPTVAMLQRINFEPGVATGTSSGLASLYNAEFCDSELGATRGGMVVPDMTALSGQRCRLVWTDEGSWRWEGLSLPPGVRIAPLEQMIALDEAVDCRGRFGPSGLAGVFSSPLRGLSDAVISVPGLPLAAAKIRAGGAFTSGVGDVLASGEFMAESLLTDAQQRRGAIYQQLVGGEQDADFTARPTLHLWADSVDTGFVFPQSNRLGSTFVSIPMRLERSPAGSKVTVPSSFLGYRAVVGPDGDRPTAYSNLSREWGVISSSGTDWVRFQVPEVVLPLELSRAVLSLEIRAPSRLVEVLGWAGDGSRVVQEFSHPIGAYRAVLDGRELLQLDEDGGLLVGIRVGEDQSAGTDDPMGQASWRIDSLQLEIVGTVQGE